MQTAHTGTSRELSSRNKDFDVYPGFVSPPEGYGEVAFYWWVGEKLTKERLSWQLEQLKDHHITGLQINYAHSDEGGELWGLTYESDPPLFSEPWWELFTWFAEKAGSYGIAVSLSDYTLCSPGQGWYTDEILAKRPDAAGWNLAHFEQDAEEKVTELKLPENTLSICAFPLNDEKLEREGMIDLTPFIESAILHWQKPAGSWRLVVVYAEPKPKSIDPMHRESGAMVIEHFFQRFEDRLSGIDNAKLGFFFSDELDFGIRGQLWNGDFRKEFLRRKGYDVVPELAALFTDIGPRTPKIRLDYNDVMVELSEEGYFIPVFEWHEQRGMTYGCDHGGRGKDATEFGDYFRTQRWNQGPGCDQPSFESDLIKNKVASSIAHLYERPRTWLEGFYGTGWGTSTEDVTDAIFRNFVSGHNLLTLHGLYYTTYGGWWEWAPPCNHFRMPYWEHMKHLLACTERLSYLFSQGVHVCDVAILYPVAAMEGGLDGNVSVETAFRFGEHLYSRGIDFDFMDFQSLERATIQDRELRVSGEGYRVLILPSMRSVRYSTLQQAKAFQEAGGVVIALDRLPEASERAGASDPVLDGMVREMFGWSASEADVKAGMRICKNPAGGIAMTARSFSEAEEVIASAFPRDFDCMAAIQDHDYPYVMHRRIGQRDIYAVYGETHEAECFFRCHGDMELWNPWDGSVKAIQAERVTSQGTYVKLPLSSKDIRLIVFSPSDSRSVQESAEAIQPREYGSGIRKTLLLDGVWSFQLQPTMDNRFGDFRQPPEPGFIGAEARRFSYAAEWVESEGEDQTSIMCHDPSLDDSSWRQVTYGYGPHFWKLGPLPKDGCPKQWEETLAQLSHAPDTRQETVAGNLYEWGSYSYSTRLGIEGDPGHQGYHGLKGEITDDFIAIGQKQFTLTDTHYVSETEGEVVYLWTTFHAGGDRSVRLRIGGIAPERLWLNGQLIDVEPGEVSVQEGSNTVLLCYERPGRGHVIFERMDAPADWVQPMPLAMSWHNKPGVLAYDVFPGECRPTAGWYRFTAPPGLHTMQIHAHGNVQVWVDGEQWDVHTESHKPDGSVVYRVAGAEKKAFVSLVAVRIQYDHPSFYEGSAIPEPIRLECGEGIIIPGDWSQIDGLTCYSGGAVYRREIEWDLEESSENVTAKLDLGRVSATAEISVNDQHVCTLLHAPWSANIAPWLQPGKNTIEVKVFNTLANHYVTIPTRYRGDLTSGMMGPVRLDILSHQQ
ncbi:glycosyl hydrolase [Paenibacillus lemnae]|uniref:Glycosyl hydrolases family 2 sugar binding domain-containing protein n=1 Tax=Paenibacillus lemnae TaxID=1330551 RepID=A0A848ME44_PAELE|nr:glycosyl hydrolase [Paenibacillus lemnae]NMO97674.1 hypothetical protein [Paenibacillus lemnae]